ncbi:hypothetical protein HN873_067112 [Arachis hypogaea]
MEDELRRSRRRASESLGKILEVLKNWHERSTQVIVVIDGERILGLRDLGCQGMGIPVGKLALYTTLGGFRPSAEYSELLSEFMVAVKQNYGEKVLVQFEDFVNHNAFELLAKYGTSHLGTASVVLAGVVAALKLIGGTLADHTFLFFGAGEARTGIAELIALEISLILIYGVNFKLQSMRLFYFFVQTKKPIEETCKKIWLVDSKPGERSYRTFFLERRNRDIMKRQRRQVLFSGIITAIGISLHNFPEGMAVFLGSVKGLQVGLNLALAIAMHNIPKGIAIALPVYFATER